MVPARALPKGDRHPARDNWRDIPRCSIDDAAATGAAARAVADLEASSETHPHGWRRGPRRCECC